MSYHNEIKCLLSRKKCDFLDKRYTTYRTLYVLLYYTHTTHNTQEDFLQHTEKVTFLHGLFFLSVFGVFYCLLFLYLYLCVLKMGCVCVLMLFLCFCFVLFFEKRKGRKGRKEGRKGV